jgi:hypothetical protein
VRAPSATREAHEIGCSDDKEVVGSDVRLRDASSLGDPTESGFLSVNKSKETEENRELGRYEVYIVSPQLKGELGMALIDSGSMVSIVRESSVTRFRSEREQVELQGITGQRMNVLGLIDLKIENMTEPIIQRCHVVDSLPRNLDLILGQDWLEKAGYSFQKRKPVTIPPYSEQVIKCETNERGIRFIEHQLLQPGLIAASSLVRCEENEFACLVYVDDILILGETLEEHNSKLRNVFQTLREFNITIELDKCEFLKEELSYLGHIVTTNGVKPDEKKIAAVIDFPMPKSQKDIKSSLGLAGYYRRFIDNFSAIARPLTDLLKKDQLWKCGEKEQSSFDMLKSRLTKAPLLQYPDFNRPFIVTTDASGYAIGAILSQGKLGSDKPIAYASRTLNGAEVNYATVEKELLAIVWACKHFRPCLLGRKFHIVTDKGLKWVFNVKDPSSRLMRWKLLLEEYNYEVAYRAGERNCNADSLSHYPVHCLNVNVGEMTNERKLKIISELHNCPVGGHQGISRTLEGIKLYVPWPGMEQEDNQFIKNCKICQLNKETSKNVKLPLTITDTKSCPWEKLYLDIVGPLTNTQRGMRYEIIYYGSANRKPNRRKGSRSLCTNIILIYGIPNEIVTDQGSNFMGDVFKRICKLFKIEKINTTAYHPE